MIVVMMRIVVIFVTVIIVAMMPMLERMDAALCQCHPLTSCDTCNTTLGPLAERTHL
jgi:hypothetical protein